MSIYTVCGVVPVISPTWLIKNALASYLIKEFQKYVIIPLLLLYLDCFCSSGYQNPIIVSMTFHIPQFYS